jgi:hypothetical protein
MARGKTVYLKSESGRVENFDQFRERLKTLGTSETLRFRELRQLLSKEARPLMTKARLEAYKDSPKKGKGAMRQRAKGNYSKFYNLYKTIDIFPNKGTEKAYVVVGLDGHKGAYYANWQLFGGARAGRRGKKYEEITTKKGKASGYALYRSHMDSGIVKRKGLPAKRFFDKALANSAVPARAQKLMTNFVLKRIKDKLR